ncbi:hypothetical protein D3C72_1987350 [compost metagenome]
MQVAGKVRNSQAIPFHSYESTLTTPVRNVHRAFAFNLYIAGDKEGVRFSDHGFGGVIQPVETLSDTGRRVSQRH